MSGQVDWRERDDRKGAAGSSTGEASIRIPVSIIKAFELAPSCGTSDAERRDRLDTAMDASREEGGSFMVNW